MSTEQFILEDGTEISVEVEQPLDQFGNPIAVGAGGADKNKQQFSAALGIVRPVANQLVNTLTGLSKTPSEVSVEFGLKLSGEAGAFIAKASTEANFKVKLTWTGNS